MSGLSFSVLHFFDFSVCQQKSGPCRHLCHTRTAVVRIFWRKGWPTNYWAIALNGLSFFQELVQTCTKTSQPNLRTRIVIVEAYFVYRLRPYLSENDEEVHLPSAQNNIQYKVICVQDSQYTPSLQDFLKNAMPPVEDLVASGLELYIVLLLFYLLRCFFNTGLLSLGLPPVTLPASQATSKPTLADFWQKAMPTCKIVLQPQDRRRTS